MASANLENHPEYGPVLVLAAGNVQARIAPDRGSNLFSLKVGEIELIHVHPDRPLGPDFTGNFCIYPVPNRVRNSKFTFEGTECSFEGLIPPRGNDVLVHGLVRALSWNYGKPLTVDAGAIGWTHVHWDESREEFDRFPFTNTLEHRYTITPQGVLVDYTTTNLSGKRMPYGYALHPSFKRLSPNDRVRLPAKSVLEMDDELLPTGESIKVRGKKGFDLNKAQLLSALDLDHVYTDLTGFPSIEYPEHDLRVTIESSEDFRFVVIHTRDPKTVEIEPQTCSTDAFNAPNPVAAGLLVLEPGEQRSGSIMYHIT